MRNSCLLTLLTLILVACGTDGHHFSIDGRLINMNQGEFYVYSPDGGLNGLDTIKVQGGRFSYEIPCEKEATLVIIFPNYSEHVVFAQPGKSVDFKGDASHLKEVEVKGTDANDLMTTFRQDIVKASPPEIVKHVERFVENHPTSIVGGYLVQKYLLKTPRPNYVLAARLLALMVKEQPENGYLKLLKQRVDMLVKQSNDKLSAFVAYDVKGEKVTNVTVTTSPVTIIYTWASWSYDSQDLQRRLKQLKEEAAGKLQLIGFNLDGSKSDCLQNIENQAIDWSIIWNEQLFQSQAIQQLNLTAVPDNLLLQNGKIIARGLLSEELINKTKTLLPH